MENEQKQSIRELAELLHENNLGEIEYEANGVYIRIAGVAQNTNMVVSGAAPAPAVIEEKALPSVKDASLPAKADETINSPMVGVVYLSKDPSSPDFVKIGDKVSVGQTVCLIEAMKTYNPIKATKAGKITAVLVESGSPVEYGQPLFSVA